MKRLATLILILCSSIASFAWNESGHETGGAIAYYYLKAYKPEVIAKVIKTLESHPWYNTAEWNDKLVGLLTAEQKDIALFMLASTWETGKHSPQGNNLQRVEALLKMKNAKPNTA